MIDAEYYTRELVMTYLHKYGQRHYRYVAGCKHPTRAPVSSENEDFWSDWDFLIMSERRFLTELAFTWMDDNE